MGNWAFHQLDVFTSTPLTGNPLAVFPDAAGLDAGTMQALAREMNLSETTFVSRSSKATRKIRFFTPAAEIPLAGHPTIGTWWALAELGLLDGLPEEGNVTLTQETGHGVLPVELTQRRGKPVRVAMTQTKPEFLREAPDRAALARAIGGPEALADGPVCQVVSTALPQLMAPVRSVEALAALPSGGRGGELADLLRTLGTDCVMLWAPLDGTTVRCRMFAPGFAVPEDPATGSAAGALGAYLVHHGLVEVDTERVTLNVRQGEEIGRPSHIRVEVEVRNGTVVRVRVGGEAVRVLSGEVTL